MNNKVEQLQRHGFTKREAEMSALLFEGHNTESISNQIETSEAAVRTILRVARLRVNCNSLNEFIVWYYQTFWEPKVLIPGPLRLM